VIDPDVPAFLPRSIKSCDAKTRVKIRRWPGDPTHTVHNEAAICDIQYVVADACEKISLCEPFAQLRPPSSAGDILDGDHHGLLLTHQNDQSFASCDTGVEKVALEHGVMLRRDRNDDDGVFGAL
jgi:hypothetical protein